MFRHLYVVIVGISLVLSLPIGGTAQSTFGSITGTVMDPSGAVVPGAQVQVTNEGTGTVREVTTSSGGVFNVPNLDYGTYKVRVSAKGFKTFERGSLHLTANQIVDVPVQMSVGAASTVVEVQGASPVITTEANDITGSVGHDAVEALPLVSRHTGDQGVYAFTLFNTGVESVPSSSLAVVNGARLETGTLPTMDGIAVMAYFQGAGPVQPGMEDVQEVKVETAVAPAEFATAGNIQVTSRSGTNQYHGGAFWDYNGNALNARNFFSSTVPFRVYNDFAASIGGPIKKDKWFFFFDYEGSREAAQKVETEDVPTQAMRNGNFTGVATIDDPTTGLPFANDTIPSGRISTVAQNVQNYAYPLPNAGGPGALSNNWEENEPGTTGFTIFNNFDARVDYSPTHRDTIFGRGSFRRMPLAYTDIYPLSVTQLRYGESAVFAWTHIISPTMVNEFRFGSTYHKNFYQANAVGSTLVQQFGITGLPAAGAIHDAPEFDITGVTEWDLDQQCDSYENNPETTLEWIDNLSWTKGRHFMKFGFDAVRDDLNGNKISSDIYGQYGFTGVYTGSGYADFLLGIPQSTTVGIASPEWDFRGTTYGLYGQDQFRVNSKLTLNYGLRWELEQPYISKTGSIFNFNPANGDLVVPNNGANHINPFYPTNIPIETATAAGYPASSLLNFNKRNFQPRIGFAYKLFGDSTVVRGGYGIYTNLIYAPLIRGQMSGGPFAGNVTYNNTTPTAATSPANPFTPTFQFPSPFLTSGSAPTQNVAGVNPDLKTPYTQEWNISVEHQFKQIGFRISYLGSRSDQLIYRRNLNEPPPSTTPYSSSEKRYPIYGNSVTWADSGGNDSYNGLEVSATKKYGQNLIFNVGWTWSKDLTDTQDAGGGGTTFGGQVLTNEFNRAIEKSNSEYVLPQRLYAYALYTLPVGHGQRLLSSAHGPLQQAVGGWRTTWTLDAQSGEWFSPSFSGFDPSNAVPGGGGIPDRIANGNLPSGQRGVTGWFNAAAFAIPGCPDSQPVCKNPANVGRFGDSGFNILSGPPLFNIDFGLRKEFRVVENIRLTFTATMANALNHPAFSNPSANISAASSVAKISSQTRVLLGEVDPREIDLGFRLSF